MTDAFVPLTPPGPKSRLPGDLLLRFRRDPLAFFLGIAREHGDVARFRVAGQWVYMLNDPELIKEALVGQNKHFVKGGALKRSKFLMGEGLLTSEGDHHLRQRRLVQPAFHRARIGAYADVMAAYAQRVGDRWADGQELDLAHEMMHLTLAIAGKTLFDADVEGEATEIEDIVNALLAIFGVVTLPGSEIWRRIPTTRNRRAQRAIERLDAIVHRMIADRRAAGASDRGDLLSMLIMSQDTEGDGGGMTDKQVRDEAVTLLLAGHETTANALNWLFWQVARHPEVESKLHAELDAVLGGRLPTMADLKSLPYTEKVITESLRLYPPGWAIARLAAQPVTIGRVKVPQGALVFMSPYVMHRNPRFYPDAERFDPDRWTPEFKSGLPKFAYFPFSGGARGCIGEPFAWMEAMIIVATLAQRWRIRPVEGHPVVPEPLVTLRPKHGIQVRLEARRPVTAGASV